MTMTMSTSLFFFISHLSLSSASHYHHDHSSSNTKTTTTSIQQVCKATRFPDQCVSSLSQTKLPPNPTPLQFVYTSISLSSQNLLKAQSMVKSILASSTGNKTAQTPRPTVSNFTTVHSTGSSINAE